jgi:hypothetical protein
MLGPLPPGFIAPCLPTRSDRCKSGPDWVHEIKHDGYRMIARRASTQAAREQTAMTKLSKRELRDSLKAVLADYDPDEQIAALHDAIVTLGLTGQMADILGEAAEAEANQTRDGEEAKRKEREAYLAQPPSRWRTTV